MKHCQIPQIGHQRAEVSEKRKRVFFYYRGGGGFGLSLYILKGKGYEPVGFGLPKVEGTSVLLILSKPRFG